MLIGEWQSDYGEGQGYKKNNRVLIFNSELQSKIDNNTYAPATQDANTGAITFDTTHWTVIHDGRDTYGLPTALATKADKVSGATSGNIAGLDDNGNPTDSGYKPTDFAKVSVYGSNPVVDEYKYYNGSTLSGTTTGRILLPGKHYEVDEVQTVDSTDYGLTFFLPIVADDGTPYLEGYDPQTDDEIHNVQEWFFAFTASANASGITFRLGAKGSSVKVNSAAIEAGKTYEVTIVYNKKRNEYYVVQFGFSES